LVLSGHFHTPSEKENIKYIGSPYQQSFNDVDSPRGYYIFDDDEYQLEFIEFSNASKYIHLYSDEELSREKIEGNVVKLIYKEELSLQEDAQLVNLIKSYEPLSLVTDFSNINCSNEEITQEENVENFDVKNNEELLFEYIDKIETPNHIKKPTLKKMISNIDN
jgi:DNA repair exonuclease SbcCD nuclease subunit